MVIPLQESSQNVGLIKMIDLMSMKVSGNFSILGHWWKKLSFHHQEQAQHNYKNHKAFISKI